MADNALIGAEQARRLDVHRTGADIHRQLEAMNDALAPLERYAPSGVARPDLFIFGLPRSGTTMLYQLVACCLDVGYINGIAARFWRAPLAGAALARAVLGERRDASFASNYGRSIDPAGPHEFSYFWQRWLGIHDVETACDFRGEAPVDWAGLSRVLGALHDFHGAALVHKTNFVANRMAGFAAHVPMPLFIYIERDPAAVALSILGARRRFYGDVSAWWATYPPDFRALERLPFGPQIAGQVRSLRATYEDAVAQVPAALSLRLTYGEVCDAPAASLARIREAVRRAHGYDIALRAEPPARFERSAASRVEGQEEKAVLAALAELGVAA